ncbi:hypothetical protein lerEdw1_017276 [Lerista edwardsae]|nr:hypothetical protein lerEdw1_017276 [Lerista edwardsae]
MENEKSRIPIFKFANPKTISVLKDTQNTKKQGLDKTPDPSHLKNPEFAFIANPPSCVVFRGTNKRAMKSAKKAVEAPPPSKKTVIAPVRSTVSKSRREVELRNRNKELETTKCELSLKVSGMQSTIKDLEEKNSDLEKENQKLKKFQESCMLVLEARNWDPVTGDSLFEEEEESKKTRTEIMVLTEKLSAGLELFSQMVKEQKDTLQNTDIKWKQAEEQRAHFLEQQQSFHKEMENMSALLDKEEKEALLN